MNTCRDNLKSIALGLYNYGAQHGHFPPAYTVDSNGVRLHSWRTLILPYLEQRRLYESIDLTKSWDDPVNAKARQQNLGVYECPTAFLFDRLTTYLALVGPTWAFTGSTPRTLADFKDRGVSTLSVIDVGPELAVHWMSPHDLDPTNGPPFVVNSHSNRSKSFLAAFIGAKVIEIPQDIPPAKLEAMLSIDGGVESAF